MFARFSPQALHPTWPRGVLACGSSLLGTRSRRGKSEGCTDPCTRADEGAFELVAGADEIHRCGPSTSPSYIPFEDALESLISGRGGSYQGGIWKVVRWAFPRGYSPCHGSLSRAFIAMRIPLPGIPSHKPVMPVVLVLDPEVSTGESEDAEKGSLIRVVETARHLHQGRPWILIGYRVGLDDLP